MVKGLNPKNERALMPLADGSRGLMHNPSMSRRTFFSLSAAVGVLTFVGSVCTPGRAMVSAWADEDSKIHFTIYVLGRDELPILCFDVSDADKKQPVEGMSITITSENNNKTVTTTSNADGFAPVHVRALSQQASISTQSSYSFYGKVEASKDGYRAFCHPSTHLATGVSASAEGSHSNTLEIPTHAVGPNDIYLRTAALDDADVQYCSEKCGVGPENTIEHTFTVEAIAPAGSSIDVKVVLVSPAGTEAVWGEATLSGSSDDPTSYATTFKGAWLSSAQKGSMLKVKFGKHGETAYVMSSKVQFVDEVAGLADATGSASVNPGRNSDTVADVCPIPGWIMKAGDTFSCEFPAVPIKIFSDNKANFGIACTLMSLSFLKYKNGEDQLQDSNSLKHIFGGQGVQKAWNDYKHDISSAWEGYRNSDADQTPNRSFGRTALTAKLDMSFSLQFMAYLSWQADEATKEHYWTGDAAILMDLGVAFSYTEQFVFGMFPLYVGFDFAADVSAKMLLGMKFGGEFKNVQWGHSLGKSHMAIIVVIHVEIGFSVAIGIVGIIGVGLRGSAYLHSEYAFDEVEGKKFPHITLGICAKLDVFVQVFFLKKTWNLLHTPENNLYNNWSTSATNGLNAAMSRAGLRTAFSPSAMRDASVVTEDELAFAAEYVAAWKPGAADAATALSLESGNASASLYVFTRIEKGRNRILSVSENEVPAFESPYGDDGSTTYNPLRGLKPTYKNQLFADGYSNSRLKVAHGYSGFFDDRREPILAARLVTVLIPDKEGVSHSVTRVAIASWNPSDHAFADEEIVDFSISGMNAWERNDVDFDFDLAPYSDEDCPTATEVAYIAVTSVIRPDEESAEAYEKQQFVTIFQWYPYHQDRVDATKKHVQSLRSLLDPGVIDDSGIEHVTVHFATSHPRVLIQSQIADHLPGDELNMPFLYHYKTNVETGVTTLNVTAYYPESLFDFDLAKDLVLIEDLPDGLSSEDFRHGSFEVYTLDRSDIGNMEHGELVTRVVVGWTGRNSSLPVPEGETDDGQGAPYSFLRVFILSNDDCKVTVSLQDSLDLPNVSSLRKVTVQGGLDAPFIYHDDSSKAEEKPYKLVKFNVDSYFGTTKFVVQDSAGATKMSKYFAAHDGKWLYTVRQVKHKVPGLTDESKEAVAAGGKVYSSVYKDDDNYGDTGDVTTDGGQLVSYQLLEARWHDKLDSYYWFYPIAQLDSCPDYIDVVDHADGRRDFVFANISAVDKNETETRYALDEEYEMDDVYHVADIYHVAVPHALGLHVKDLKVTSPFAAVGESANLMVTLANTGNWYITGFDVAFFDCNDKLITITTFDDLENRVQDTHQNYKQVLNDQGERSYDDDGQPLSEQQQSIFDQIGMLPPGLTRTYRIEFTIPKGYEGETEFSLQVMNPRCETSSVRSDYISDDDFQVESELAYVDPNVHGVAGSSSGAVEHVWTFNSNGAPYTKEGEDPQPEPTSYEITVQPASVTAKAGDSVSMTIAAMGASTYQWQHSKDGATWHNTKWSGYNTNTLTFKMLDVLDGRLWRCAVSFANGTSDVSDAAATTLQAPSGSIFIQPASSMTTIGSLVILHVIAEGDVASYQWQHSKDGTKWSNTNWFTYDQALFHCTMLEALIDRQWRCVITFQDGTQITSRTVRTMLLDIRQETACAGDAITLSALAPNGATDFQWQHSKDDKKWNNTKWTGYDSDTFTFKMLASLDRRMWRCKFVLADGTIAYSIKYTSLLES